MNSSVNMIKAIHAFKMDLTLRHNIGHLSCLWPGYPTVTARAKSVCHLIKTILVKLSLLALV